VLRLSFIREGSRHRRLHHDINDRTGWTDEVKTVRFIQKQSELIWFLSAKNKTGETAASFSGLYFSQDDYCFKM
jgi:hypothetical protein